MLELGMACDGGKDSLSMAASAGGETVKAPGNLVVSAYVRCPDITATVTPDLKLPGTGRLLLVDLAAGLRRLGGSNLAQAFSQVRRRGQCARQTQYICKHMVWSGPIRRCSWSHLHAACLSPSSKCMAAGVYIVARSQPAAAADADCGEHSAQIGDESPDVDIGAVGAAFNVTQRLLEERRISAGHDVSDGGLAVALLEMAFAGNVGIRADVSAAHGSGPLAALFAEELGLLLEVGATVP